MNFYKIISFCLVSFSSLAQNSDFGNWLIYIGDKKINSKLNFHNEIQYRNYNALGDTEQLLLRTGVGYNLSERNNNVLLGYAFINSQNYLPNQEEKTKFNEHRLFQQFITRQAFGRVNIQHRYRLEERFFKDDFRLRFRYFLATTVALNHKQMKDKTLYLSAYNEIFINTKNILFDRNRVYAGIGYRFSPKVRLELGYMNQIFNQGSRDQFNVFTYLNL